MNAQADDPDRMTYDQAFNYLDQAEELYIHRFGSRPDPTPADIIAIAAMMVQIELKTNLDSALATALAHGHL